MSWKKEVGIVGLWSFTPREASRGAFQFEEFQFMVDPLGDPDEEKYRSVVKEVKVSKVLK